MGAELPALLGSAYLLLSDTTVNILFGPLEVEVAKNLHMSVYWLAAANTGGATAGKMISPQSNAVVTAAIGIIGLKVRYYRFKILFSICSNLRINCILWSKIIWNVGRNNYGKYKDTIFKTVLGN